MIQVCPCRLGHQNLRQKELPMRSELPWTCFGATVRTSAAALALSGTLAIAQNICPVSTVNPPGAGCATVLNGCICGGTISGTISSFPDCEGCSYSGTVTQSCTWAHAPGQTFTYQVSGQMECGSRIGVTIDCPCDGGTWTPIVIKCGSCGG